MFFYVLKCSVCSKLLTYDKFSKKNNSKRGYSYKCKNCHNEYVRDVWYKKNSDKQKQSSKTWKDSNKSRILAVKYKTTELEISNLLNRASHRCEVCGTVDNLCIDHCHSSNKVRGILCRSCNSALGLLKESSSVVENLITYIKDRC